MKKIISLVVSLVILAIIYTKVDLVRLLEVFHNSDRLWMVVSLAMVIPLTLLTSWRLQQLMPRSGVLHFGEANRLILASSTLNMILPSKMGDIAKAYFMRKRGHLEGSLALSLVIFEKTCDMLSLLLWCVFGLCFYPNKDFLFWVMTLGVTAGLLLGISLLSSRRFAYFFFTQTHKMAPGKLKAKIDQFQYAWDEMHGYFWQEPTHLAKVAATSVLIWFGHLLQIWFFIFALQARVPLLANLALSPLAILAGLLPLTFAGVGTRDAALILFYQPYFSQPIGAALGLLCTSRYLIPAVAGLPFLGKYFIPLRKMKG